MLFCHERREQITHRRTIVKIDRSNSLTVTTTVNRYCNSIKKQLSEERRERFALKHKKGGNCKKL